MKVLVTGKNSYAGTQFAKRITDLNMGWKIDYISVRTDDWKEKDFSIYDAVYHAAAIVHQKEKVENEKLYYEVNKDLTYDLAKKAKAEGVRSFIFLSTMAVYGMVGKIGEDTIITRDTKESPTSFYGKSKLEAEQLLAKFQSKDFNVSILRTPMIYGKDCPGNYSLLSKLANLTPIFPNISNKRSLIFIDHLSDIVIHLIENNYNGLFLVKNPEDINTLTMVNEIAKVHNRKLHHSNVLGFFIKVFGNRIKTARKVFGNIIFKAEDCAIEGFNYKKLSFEESIELAEGRKLGDYN